MEQSKLDRINELSKKSKTVGLTDEEKQILTKGCLINYYASLNI